MDDQDFVFLTEDGKMGARFWRTEPFNGITCAALTADNSVRDSESFIDRSQ
jgi:hypothetical protein